MAQATTSTDSGVGIGTGSRRREWTLRGTQMLVGLFFAFSAVPKLVAHSSAVEIFDRIGFGDWFMYAVGVAELAGAVGLFVTLLSGAASIGLIGLMIGAFVTQLTALDGENAATPLILLVPLVAVAWYRRHTTPALLARLRADR